MAKYKIKKGWKFMYLHQLAQVDYKFMNKKWIKSALNSEDNSSFEGLSSDHIIVSGNIHLSLCRNKKLLVIRFNEKCLYLFLQRDYKRVASQSALWDL